MPKKKPAKPKLVLDSNVIISALVFGGKPREILELAVRGLVDIAISDDILEEIRGVLGGKKFQYPARIVRALIIEIEDLAHLVQPKEKIEAIAEDPEDNRVLECAVEIFTIGHRSEIYKNKNSPTALVDPASPHKS